MRQNPHWMQQVSLPRSLQAFLGGTSTSPTSSFSHRLAIANTSQEAKFWFPLFNFCLLHVYSHRLLPPYEFLSASIMRVIK